MWKSNDLRSNNFDAMRLGMAILVILSHSFTLLSGTQHDSEPLRKLTGNVLSIGELAVDVFFIISGFLITMSWERSRSVIDYLKRRVLRIVPGYMYATFLCAFVVAPLAVGSGQAWFSSRLLGNIAQLGEYKVIGTFAQNPWPGTMNGSIWTIGCEFRCYLLVVPLGLIGVFRRPWIVAAIFLALLTAQVNPQGIPGLDWLSQIVGNVGLATCFTAGSLFYLWRRHIPCSGALAAQAALLLAGSLLTPRSINFIIPLTLPYLIFWAAFQRHLVLDHFSKHGDWSYGTYLYAFVIQQSLIACFPGRFSALGLFAVAAPLSVGAGILSWHLIEKRFLSSRRIERTVADGKAALGSVAAPPVGAATSD